MSALASAGRAHEGTKPRGHAAGGGAVAPTWRQLLPKVVAAADLATGIVAVLIALRLRFQDVPDLRLAGRSVSYAAACLVVALAWPPVLAACGAYRRVGLSRGIEGVRRVVVAGVVVFCALALVHMMLDTTLSGRLVVQITALLTLAGVGVRLATDQVVMHARGRNLWRRRVVVLGTPAESASLVHRFTEPPAHGVEVVGSCTIEGTDGGTDGGADADEQSRAAARAAMDLMHRTGADLLAITGGLSASATRALAWMAEGTGTDVMIAPAVPDVGRQPVAVEVVGAVPLLRVESRQRRWGRVLVKGVVDRVGAALLLVVLCPVLAAIAVAIRVTSPGPVLYRQLRVGRHGSPFVFRKFRTMEVGADTRNGELARSNEADGLLFKIREDPRLTSIGPFLRRTTLDELPQLWNVLRGDMSLVGPRPLAVPSDAFVGEDEMRRLRVKPGITGLWQVSGASELSWQDSVALDMHYVDHWSLGLDLAILARTPIAVLRGRGVY
jgi:exopolysaccharide biosynthesis polyprenyl glycosylphosphotransferase